MKNKEDLHKELEALAPFLAKQKNKKDGFVVSKYYFENLEDKILSEVTKVEKQVSPSATSMQLSGKISFWSRFKKPQYAFAFSVCLLAIVAMAILLPTQTNTGTYTAEITIEEAADYIDENIDAFSLDLLVEMSSIDMETDVLDEIELDDEILEDYIDDNILYEVDDETLEELL